MQTTLLHRRVFSGEGRLGGKDDDEQIVEEEPVISVHALSGMHSPQTIRFKGRLCGGSLTFLVDTCSTHNFINRKSKSAGVVSKWVTNI